MSTVPDAHVKLVEEVAQFKKQDSLHHVDSVNDRSAPVIEQGVTINTWDKAPLLEEIQHGAHLKHVETRDASKPVIEENVHIQENPHKNLMEEVKTVGVHKAVVLDLKRSFAEVTSSLKKVETEDKAQPIIPAEVDLHKFDKQALLNEIQTSVELKHVGDVSDRSAPVVDPNVHLKPSPHNLLVEEIVAGTQLRHVGTS